MYNKVAIYVRVSTDEQRDNGYSIDSQLRMLKEYADKNNYNIHSLNDTLWEPEDKSCCRKPRPQRGAFLLKFRF